MNLLILRPLDGGPTHGLGIKDAIADLTGGAIQVEVGALYPALHRMHRDALVDAEWGQSDKGRRAKIYTLTEKGRVNLEAEMRAWRRHVEAVSAVVGN